MAFLRGTFEAREEKEQDISLFSNIDAQSCVYSEDKRRTLYWVWDSSTEIDCTGFLPAGSEFSLPTSNQKAVGSIEMIPWNKAKRVTRKNRLFSGYILLILADLIDQLRIPYIIFNKCCLPALCI